MSNLFVFVLLIAGTVESSGTVVEPTVGVQAFKPVGHLYQHVSYAQLGLQVDFDIFLQRLRGLDKLISTLKVENGTSPYLLSIFAHLHAVVRPAVKRTEAYQEFFLGGARAKRQMLAVAAVAASAAALFEDFEQVASLTDDTAILVRNVRKLKGAFEMLYAGQHSLQTLGRLEAAMIEMEADTNRFFAGLDRLMDNKLSLELVDDMDMRNEFHELMSAASEEGYGTVFRSHTQVYQLPATFCVLNGSVFAIVPIPIVPRNEQVALDIFVHQRLPVLSGDQVVRVFSDQSFLAMNKEKTQFVPMSGGVLHSCKKIGDTYLCPFSAVTVLPSRDNCLLAIFLQDAQKIASTCSVELVQETFLLDRLNDTAFVSYAANRELCRVTCGHDSSELRLSGLQVVVCSSSPWVIVRRSGIIFRQWTFGLS